MKVKSFFISVLFHCLSFGQQNGNWQKLKSLGSKCGATYIYNMRETKRNSSSQVSVSQKSLGFSSNGIIELTTSIKKEKLPIFGEFLDIFVEKIKTEDGYDYWKECVPKN